MRIELLLGSVNQDQCVPAGEEVFYGWMHGPSSGSDGDEDAIAPQGARAGQKFRLPRFALRKERWGAVFIYGPTQGVYQTDDEAFLLLSRLKFGDTIDQMFAEPRNFSQEKISEFATLITALEIS